MTDGNLLFDGASLGKKRQKGICHILKQYVVLLFFGLTTHVTSVRPGRKKKYTTYVKYRIFTYFGIAIKTITDSINVEDSLKNIAAAHFIIVLSITGISS